MPPIRGMFNLGSVDSIQEARPRGSRGRLISVIEDFDVAAYVRPVGMSGCAHGRVDVLVNHIVFQVKVYACIVVALTRPSRYLCAVDRRNRAVAVVPKSAYQDAQADTFFEDYARSPSASWKVKALGVTPRPKGALRVLDVNSFVLMELSALTSSKRTR